MIIGLGYKARSGKDTVAAILSSYGGEYDEASTIRVAAFADTLKAACGAIFGLDKEQLYGATKEVPDPFWGDTPRRILQLVGTECLRRGYRDDVWITALQRRIRCGDLAGAKHVVVTDCRFPNELAAIKEWGGVTVRIDRPMGPGATGGVTGHSSETALDGAEWDHVIDNSGTLVELHAQVTRLARQLGL